ncbi:MAG: electron transfer flavoprotein subunit beta/FixA family protein [Cyclobacteriaceae bacterium]|nr:electron transfer flavoprotein subunit beta/FixA family protein [Cyclobacteriaceae bacterium]
MKILVCITHVPDTTSRIAFVDNNTKFDSNNVQFIIGPYDDYAISKAVDLKTSHQASVTVLNVGLPDSDPTLRRALAIGADDAIRVNAEPVDSFYVAKQIAEVVRNNQYDLILMGRESIDFNGGIVHAMVGEMVKMPAFSPVMEMEIEDGGVKLTREIEGGKEYIETKLPLIAGCQEPIAEWKIPNMRGIMTARTKPFKVLQPVDSDIRTKTELFSLPKEKGKVRMVDPENVDELVELLIREAKVI